jgi:hypothetical protein
VATIGRDVVGGVSAVAEVSRLGRQQDRGSPACMSSWVLIMIPTAAWHTLRSGLCSAGATLPGRRRWWPAAAAYVIHRLFTGYDRKTMRIIGTQQVRRVSESCCPQTLTESFEHRCKSSRPNP